jgi:apolipoprotein N-acyltransferase
MQNPRLHGEIKRIAQASGSYLLVGSAQRQKFGKQERKKSAHVNSAFLIDPVREMPAYQRYDKIRLFPFGEYLPLKETLPWSYINVPDVSGYEPGEEYTVFELPNFRFGVTICWENIFPDLVRQFVKRGAQFIANITNEAWFGRTATPYQFVSMSVFRAVENRVSVVRATNTGVSCFIDPYGRITGRVESSGKDIFIPGHLTQEIPLSQGKTFYTAYGDVFVYICLIITLMTIVLSCLKAKP